MSALGLQLIPVLSEKAFGGQEATKQVVVFKVPVTANKHAVKAAVEQQFEVAVSNVRTLKQDGKALRVASKRSRPITTHRADTKKAYVTLAEGSRITIIEEVEEKK